MPITDLLLFCSEYIMEINTYNPVKIRTQVKPCITDREICVEELKHADTSSSEALSSYAVASLGINTGIPALSKCYTQPKEYTRLSDEEFEVYAEKIKEKADTLPEEIKKYFNFSFLTKDNIFIFDKVLSEEKLYGDKRALSVAFSAASALQYDNSAPELKNKLANKLLSDENLYGNENIADNTIYIISAATDSSRYELEDKMLSNENLCNNIFLPEFLFDSIAFTSDEAITAMNDFTDKILENPQRFSNKKIKENLLYLYKHVPEKTAIMRELLDKGAGFNEAYETIHDKNKYEKLKESLKNPNSLRKLICSEDFDKKIGTAAKGKYQENLTEVFIKAKDIMSYDMIKKLCSETNEQEFLSCIKKIATSTYKFAMNTPNQYLSDIDRKYTTKVNGKYPKLPEGELFLQQRRITSFFENNAPKMVRAVKYTDIDTLNQAADKRTSSFEKFLNDFDELSVENCELLSKLINCKNAENGKVLSAKEKIELCRIVEIFQKGNIDTEMLTNAADKKSINIQEAKDLIQTEIIKRSGVSDDILQTIPKEKHFNEEYSYLTLLNGSLDDLTHSISRAEDSEEIFKIQISIIREMTPSEIKTATTNMRKQLEEQKLPQELLDENLELIDMYRHCDKYSDSEIWEKYKSAADHMIEHNSNSAAMFTVIRESIAGDFNDFISDPANEYGTANKKTKEAFSEAGLDYEKWMTPNLPDNNFELDCRKMTVKLWDRNPQEDLFLGNKTTCCTAVGTGSNQSAQPIFLLHTAFNVAELYDDTGKVVGMSRAFAGKVNGENALLIDNIELNNGFTKNMSDKDKTELRNRFFEYMTSYAKEINGGNDMSVYFSAGDAKVPTDDLEKVSSKTEFTGKISQNKVYINSANCRWVEPSKLSEKGEMEWLKVPMRAA